MGNFNISENPEFSEELRKLETSDRAHADVFNELFEKLLNNEVYLKRLANAMVEKDCITHDVKDADPNKVPGADVTAGLQEKIDKTNDGLLNTIKGFRLRKELEGEGWYRIAVLNPGTVTGALFNWGAGCMLGINTSYNHTNNMSVSLMCNMAFKRYSVKMLGGSINTKVISKVRFSYNSSNQIFIDIYYASDVDNMVNVDFVDLLGTYTGVLKKVNFEPVTYASSTTLIEYAMPDHADDNVYALTGGTEILSNADLNNYTALGNYYCQTNNSAVTILNRPGNIQYAFTLKVEHGIGTSYPCQTLRVHTNGGNY